MYTILIITILFFFLCNAMIYDSYYGIEIIPHFFMSMLGVLGGIMIGVMAIRGISTFYPSDYDTLVTHELVSLDDGSGFEGNFVLGSGTIKDKLVYTYYRKADNGGMVRRSISSNLATIYESDSVTVPTVKVHIVGDTAETYNWKAGTRHNGHQYYELFVPAGTIIKNINLDNK
tara:strand:- start:25601 stop:26122 length:522 start_codon:yes stop_codon:yes gene_type:complete